MSQLLSSVDVVVDEIPVDIKSHYFEAGNARVQLQQCRQIPFKLFFSQNSDISSVDEAIYTKKQVS